MVGGCRPHAPARRPGAPGRLLSKSRVTGPEEARAALRVTGDVRLADVDPRSTPGFGGGKSQGKRALSDGVQELSGLQEKLFAEGRSGGRRSVLLVVQGMDTAGKGGIMRHVVGAVDPQGVDHTAFAAPSREERKHHFLWRIRRTLPGAGRIGVFDRSHYEDVLVPRVKDLVPKEVWSGRYDEINDFEREVVESGTSVIKVMLHISREEQKARLLERLDRPDKYWKYDTGDVDERLRWDQYEQAYEDLLSRCSTPAAPWYVVPADRKWYARWAVQQLLLAHLRDLDLSWPPPDFDVDEERQRLLAT